MLPARSEEREAVLRRFRNLHGIAEGDGALEARAASLNSPQKNRTFWYVSLTTTQFSSFFFIICIASQPSAVEREGNRLQASATNASPQFSTIFSV
jgi:hypothetical protein